MNIMEMLQGQLSDGLVDQLSQQIGGASKEQTATAASGIMSSLIGALARNTATEQGAASLSNALDRDHDGGILNNLMGILSGNTQVQNERAINGAGILNHILGDRQGGVSNMVSQMSGLNTNQTSQLMTMLAPVVMGMLGKTKRENGLDQGGLASLLNGTVSQHQNSNPAMSLVTQLLDSDGDGSIMDDVANMGMKFLGGLFKK